MGAKQGLENVIEAARYADTVSAPVHFILVGDGGERARLQALAEGIERITFVPPLDAVDYRHALDAADVLLVNERPGVSEMAVPSKLTSYFDAGKPIVAATDETGITAEEIRSSGGGVIVPPSDPRQLVQAILRLANNEEEARALGEAGRQYRQTTLSPSFAIDSFARLLIAPARPEAAREIRSTFARKPGGRGHD
jgi:glycosyltransferase involved in cell wall biosynthesis